MELILAIIASGGAGAILHTLISWWLKERRTSDLAYTKELREVSKEEVARANSKLDALDAKIDALQEVLIDLVRVVELEVVPLLCEYPETSQNLRSITSRARAVV